MPNEKLEKLKHEQYVAERKLTAPYSEERRKAASDYAKRNGIRAAKD